MSLQWVILGLQTYTWQADASLSSSAITRSSDLTIRDTTLSIFNCCCWITTSETAWFPVSGASAAAAFLMSLIVAEILTSFFCYKVAVWLSFDY